MYLFVNSLYRPVSYYTFEGEGVALSTFILARVNESYHSQNAQEVLLLESFTYNLNRTHQIKSFVPVS